MKLGTMIKVNKCFAVLIKADKTHGLFQSVKTGEKICHSLSGVREKEIVFVPAN